jgi:hypothetical protein
VSPFDGCADAADIQLRVNARECGLDGNDVAFECVDVLFDPTQPAVDDIYAFFKVCQAIHSRIIAAVAPRANEDPRPPWMDVRDESFDVSSFCFTAVPFSDSTQAD